MIRISHGALDLFRFSILGAMLAGIILAQELMSVGPVFKLVAPILVMAVIAFMFFQKLTLEEKRIPITETGSFYVLAIFSYGALPLIGHLLSGMQLSLQSYGRLYALHPEPDEFAVVGWLHVLFMAFFVFAYVAFRRPHSLCQSRPLQLSTNNLKIFILFFGALVAYSLLLRIFVGVNFSSAYNKSLYEHVQAFNELGLLQRQLVVHPLGMLSSIKIGLVIWLTSNWNSRRHRWGLFAVLSYIVLTYVVAPGGRFAVISVFLAVILSYHQCVRPFSIQRSMLFVFLFLTFFFAANNFRGGGVQRILGLFLNNSGFAEGFLSVSNEFQISYGSIMSLQHTLAEHMVEIPWQVRFFDIYMVIPQQLLPFTKIDPVNWYVQVSNSHDYFTYGVIAESLLGGGVFEIVLRGVIMGGMLAAIHNWYASRPGQFWPTFFYIWLAIIIYQSFRNTSLQFLPLLLFQWLPVYLGVNLIVSLLKKKSHVINAVP